MIPLIPKEGNAYRLVAFHNCGTGRPHQVYETDAPDYPPPVLEERLEPAEKLPAPHPTRSKRSLK
jgi:hypothetical protein